MENWLIFWGIKGDAELILGICGARQNTFRELRIFVRDFGRSMHFLREQGSTDPPWGLIGKEFANYHYMKRNNNYSNSLLTVYSFAESFISATHLSTTSL